MREKKTQLNVSSQESGFSDPGSDGLRDAGLTLCLLHCMCFLSPAK